MNATINLEKNHFPVLLNELISIISPLYGGTFIDCTLGQGGYSKEILKTKLNKVIALDRDPDVLQIAKKIENQGVENSSNTVENDFSSNGLENFKFNEEETPELFNSDSEVMNEESSTKSEEEQISEDDDLEIPAFLRRQKN